MFKCIVYSKYDCFVYVVSIYMYANSISCYHPMHVPFHTHVTHTFKTWNQMELQKNIAPG